MTEPEHQDECEGRGFDTRLLLAAAHIFRRGMEWTEQSRTFRNARVRMRAVLLELAPKMGRNVTVEAQKLGVTRQHLHREMRWFRLNILRRGGSEMRQ